MRSAVLVDPENFDDSEQRFAESLDSETSSPASAPEAPAEHQPWRQEVVSRVRQHRARRRKGFDPDSSLALDFREPLAAYVQTTPNFYERALEVEPVPVSPAPESVTAAGRAEAPKVIEFPRTLATPPPPIVSSRLDELELADPVPETPRILDAPEDAPEPPAEQMDLLSGFTDLRLEAPALRATHSMELPPQPARLEHRLVAGAIDCTVVLAAEALLVTLFVSLTRTETVARSTWLCLLAASGVLWLVYQYLFLVHGNGTPGMKMTELELVTFDRKPAPRSARKWRALASALCGCSLGLGFAWSFVDEDTLGWQDRITQTYLRARSESLPPETPEIEF